MTGFIVEGARRKKAFATMAGASAAFFLGGTAQAAVHSQVVNTTVYADADYDVFLVALATSGNLVHLTFTDRTAASGFLAGATGYVTSGGQVNAVLVVGAVSSPAYLIAASGQSGGSVVNTGSGALQLASGNLIGPSQNFLSFGMMATAGSGLGPFWTGPGFVGFRLPLAGGTDFLYGWIEIGDLHLDATQATITGYGWEDTPNLATTAGFGGGSGSGSGSGSGGRSGATGTPEPATSALALLALGAAGVLRRKRQRKQTQG